MLQLTLPHLLGRELSLWASSVQGFSPGELQGSFAGGLAVYTVAPELRVCLTSFHGIAPCLDICYRRLLGRALLLRWLSGETLAYGIAVHTIAPAMLHASTINCNHTSSAGRVHYCWLSHSHRGAQFGLLT